MKRMCDTLEVFIKQVATKDRRLGDMGLQEIYEHEDTFAEARGKGEPVDENGECVYQQTWAGWSRGCRVRWTARRTEYVLTCGCSRDVTR